MNKMIKADGKTYTMVGGSFERGCIVASGPRRGEYSFVRNTHTGQWALITAGGRRSIWLTSFEVV